jgi:Nickel responsive protein SCO4226-like
MARGMDSRTRQAYFVEHYRPGLDVSQLTSAIARVRETVVELEHTGESIHYVSSTIVPNDESFYCVIEAATEENVRGAYARAGVPFERISAAILVET